MGRSVRVKCFEHAKQRAAERFPGYFINQQRWKEILKAIWNRNARFLCTDGEREQWKVKLAHDALNRSAVAIYDPKRQIIITFIPYRFQTRDPSQKPDPLGTPYPKIRIRELSEF